MASMKHKNKVLTTCTRLLFLQLLLLGLAEVIASLYLLFTCKHRSERITDVLIIPTHTCSKLVYPSYFGCAIFLSTLCGFGCVGRKATAVLVAIIAVVELGLAISLWLDHPCSLLQQDEVFHALSQSVNRCSGQRQSRLRLTGQEFRVQQAERPDLDCDTMQSALQVVCNVTHLESLLAATPPEATPFNSVSAARQHAVSLEGSVPSTTVPPRTTNTSAVLKCAVCITDTLAKLCDANASVLLPAFTAVPFIYLVISMVLASVHHRHKKLLLQADQEGKTTAEEARRQDQTIPQRLRASKIRGLQTLSRCLMCLSESLHRAPSRRKHSLDNFYLMRTLPESQSQKLLEQDEDMRMAAMSCHDSRDTTHIEQVPILLASHSEK